MELMMVIKAVGIFELGGGNHHIFLSLYWMTGCMAVQWEMVTVRWCLWQGNVVGNVIGGLVMVDAPPNHCFQIAWEYYPLRQHQSCGVGIPYWLVGYVE